MEVEGVVYTDKKAGDIGVNVYLAILVALPDDTPLPLLKVGGSPRTI